VEAGEADPVVLKRPAPYPGPRCASDNRERRKIARAQAHAGHLQRTYGLTPEEYASLLAFQGGCCYVCRRVLNGSGGKMPPVDHDHITGENRGILCTNCNRWVVTLGREGLLRGIEYLRNPPAARWRLGR
jgi:hypothetical protein